VTIVSSLAISHVMKSTGYEHQNHRFRVFRQSKQVSVIGLCNVCSLILLFLGSFSGGGAKTNSRMLQFEYCSRRPLDTLEVSEILTLLISRSSF